MSFSSNLKKEITEQAYKNSCCRKSFVQGVLSSKAIVVDNEVILSIENDNFAHFISKHISEFFGKIPDISKPKKGGRCRIVKFASKSGLRYMESVERGEDLYNPRCSICESAFFKGLFFASGRISDPEKQYLLEFDVNNCDRVSDMLASAGIEARTTVRRGEKQLYIKRSAMIEDYFALIGLNNAAFAFMNAKIEGEFRNNTNRIVNCETNNISKSVTASHRHIAVIEELERSNLLSSLPDELERTARLRIKYRDLSLSQLASVSVPAISKSGLSHRLKKIMEYAEQLLPDVKK